MTIASQTRASTQRHCPPIADGCTSASDAADGSAELSPMDPWREIETRPKLDAGGKPVDIHVRPETERASLHDADDGSEPG